MKSSVAQFRRAVCAALLLLTTGYSFAQWETSLTVEQEYNSNPFWLPAAYSSSDSLKGWTTAIDLYLGFGSDQLQAGYSGTIVRFSHLAERNYYLHSLEMQRTATNSRYGLTVEQAINKDEYQIYNYIQGSAFYSRTKVIGGTNMQWNNLVSLSKYDELDALENGFASTGLRLHKSFPTRTTLIAGIDIRYKKYLNDQRLEESVTDTLTDPGPGNGRGQGPGSGGHPVVSTRTTVISRDSPGVFQGGLTLRLAQSLTGSTGLAAGYVHQSVLSGNGYAVAGLLYGAAGSHLIFDDPLGYGSHAFAIEATQLLPAEMILRIAGRILRKNYSVQGTYSDPDRYDESVLRADQQNLAGITLRKIFDPGLPGDYGSLDVVIGFQWIGNQSNSYWYHFSARSAWLALQWSY